MLRSTVGKVMWVGKATVFMVGLAVILALVFGVVSAAFGANGGNFLLGRTNVATLITRLAGANGVNGTMFEVQNNNAGVNDTALSLKVQSGEPPMKVNSFTKVANLNAEAVDGKDSSQFVANSTYRMGSGQERAGTVLGDGSKVLSQSCLPGDRMLSGGPASVNVNSDVLDSFASDTNTWQARINDSAVSGGDSFTVVVLCADQ